jgi:outer membrane protein OmpA-like peptidoglycan-associated protein
VNWTRATNNFVSCGSALALFGCAGSMPPPELVQARNAYAEAERSEAARFDPTAVHNAKTALNEAESLFEEDSDTPEVRDAAYIALRKAERAKVEGQTVMLQTRKDEAVRNAAQTQAKAAQQIESRLESTKEELDQAKQAREAAERSAQEAMMKLKLTQAASVTEEPRGTVISVPGAFLFPTNKATILPTGHDKLDKIVEALKQQGNKKLLIEGHTDSQGSDTYNADLSKQRAEAVASYLQSHGVSREKITTAGLGESRPIASNDTPEGRANNRRVEITVERLEPH